MTDFIAEYGHFMQTQRKPKAETTIHDYTQVLRRMDREIPAGLVSATTEELYDWIFVPGRSDSTYGHYVAIAKGFGRWAANPLEPRLDFDAAALLPTINADNEKEAEPVTEDEFADILARTPDPYADLYYLGGYVGMRCVEIARARREDMTERKFRIYGKGSKWRGVPTHPKVWQRFKDRTEGPLVLTVNGASMRPSQVSKYGARHLRKLGYEDWTMHSFRKRFGTQVFENAERDLMVAKDLLGHAFVNTTQRYVAINRGRQEAAVAKL